MAGSRPVTSNTLAAAGSGSSRPAWFLQIDWADFSTRLCSYGEQTWNGFQWAGGGFEIGGFDQDGRPTSIALVGVDFRTLAATQKIRDRMVQLWKAYLPNLDPTDPPKLFKGYADGPSYAKGRLTFSVDWQASAKQFSPRRRIGPPEVNFTATPNTTVPWGSTVLRIDARR